MTTSPTRFTIDGSESLEKGLAGLCLDISQAVQRIVPGPKLEALVLAGGYGRGEGGVWRSSEEDQPYNDIEFYVFIAGNPFLNERQYRAPLEELAHELTPRAGVHVEFKIESIRKLRTGPVSMFSYDLVSAHRLICGSEQIFAGCGHHHDAANIPISEGTRLLLNRCTGLLLARELLEGETLSAEQSDFVARNLAKAKLAIGDAVLAGLHRYHWSCRERHARILELADSPVIDRTFSAMAGLLEQILVCHAAGVDFKLHPARISKSVPEFVTDHDELCTLASEAWLWLESLRLDQPFSSLGEYAMDQKPKERQEISWRNYALNARTFGLSALFDPLSGLYPRERLLSSLPLLLRKTEIPPEPAVCEHLQKQLRTNASDWPGLVRAYKHVWSGYA